MSLLSPRICLSSSGTRRSSAGFLLLAAFDLGSDPAAFGSGAAAFGSGSAAFGFGTTASTVALAMADMSAASL